MVLFGYNFQILYLPVSTPLMLESLPVFILEGCRKATHLGWSHIAKENQIITSFFCALHFRGCSLNLFSGFWESHYTLDSYGVALLAPSSKLWNDTAVLYFWTQEWVFTLITRTCHRVELSSLFQPTQVDLEPYSFTLCSDSILYHLKFW